MSAYLQNKKILGVPKESFPGEKRVALVPKNVK
jgi:alanine dehydrogenase